MLLLVEPSETAMELEDELPPKKESKANVFDLMMKAQRSPQRSPNSSRGLLLGERSPTSLDHHSQGKKDLVADPAPQANLNKHLTDVNIGFIEDADSDILGV